MRAGQTSDRRDDGVRVAARTSETHIEATAGLELERTSASGPRDGLLLVAGALDTDGTLGTLSRQALGSLSRHVAAAGWTDGEGGSVASQECANAMMAAR
jgi:hypothetical protein